MKKKGVFCLIAGVTGVTAMVVSMVILINGLLSAGMLYALHILLELEMTYRNFAAVFIVLLVLSFMFGGGKTK